MSGRLFNVEVRHEILNEVWVLVTDEDVATYRRRSAMHPGSNLVGKSDEWMMSAIAEEVAMEYSDIADGLESGSPGAFASEEKIPVDPRDLFKRVWVYRVDGSPAEVADFDGLAVDRYGRPVPPPPLPGQLDLEGKEVS